MIEVRDLHKRFGKGAAERRAVDGVSFVARDAAITGLLGPNGAGKTTTLRVVAGLLDADAGQALIDGLDVRTQREQALARLGVLSDARGLYPRLTAEENVVYFACLQGLGRAEARARLQRLAPMLEMQPLLDRRAEGFSQGERMKTALARALVHAPAHLILDEPTNGLDVVATRALRAVLRRLRDETGQCIVFSTHIMQEVERLCDEVVVVAGGRVVAQGTVPALRDRAARPVDGTTGQAAVPDFEEAFVRLAYGGDAA